MEQEQAARITEDMRTLVESAGRGNSAEIDACSAKIREHGQPAIPLLLINLKNVRERAKAPKPADAELEKAIKGTIVEICRSEGAPADQLVERMGETFPVLAKDAKEIGETVVERREINGLINKMWTASHVSEKQYSPEHRRQLVAFGTKAVGEILKTLSIELKIDDAAAFNFRMKAEAVIREIGMEAVPQLKKAAEKPHMKAWVEGAIKRISSGMNGETSELPKNMRGRIKVVSKGVSKKEIAATDKCRPGCIRHQ